MTDKHTPGPRHVEPEEWTEGLGLAIGSADGPVAIIDPENHASEEDKANARLIAAAPALLEALKWLAVWPRESERVDGKLTANAVEGLANVRRFARAAIKVAKGDA